MARSHHAATLALCIALATSGAAIAQSASGSAAVDAAISDAGRPAADTARDLARKPREMLVFADLKPGDTVLEVLPGGGYFTRLISKAVGPKGHVYAAAPEGKFRDGVSAIAADPAYGNVSLVGLDPAALAGLPPLDLIWTSQNYHDLHLTRVHLETTAVDRLWLSKLKPGGHLIVIDHAALPGAPVTETADTLHRIDPAAAAKEILSAGFVADGESQALRNPSDPHTATVFDASIRGKTDQFALRFKKPS